MAARRSQEVCANDDRDSLGSGPVPLEQDTAEDLAIGSFGDLVHELDPPDPLVSSSSHSIWSAQGHSLGAVSLKLTPKARCLTESGP
jgi:hypothetical protein